MRSGNREIAIIVLGCKHITVTANVGSDAFTGSFAGEDAETGERWNMAFELPRIAVAALAVTYVEIGEGSRETMQ